MKNVYIRIIVSLLLGFSVAWSFMWVFSLFFTGEQVVVLIATIAVLSTIIFCTFTIINEITKLKEYIKNKL